MLDRFDCYELCVQSPRHVVAFLRAAHGGEPLVLAEDFCGTAAVSRRWADQGVRTGEPLRALGVDLDADAIARAASLARRDGVAARVDLRRGDALSGPARDEPADVVFVGNFSIGYLHDRGSLLRYLRQCRERLARGNAGFGGGVLALDTYGGAGAFRLGGIERSHPGRGRETIRYTWVHEHADPTSGMVRNSISFRVLVDGEQRAELPRAFVYEWRLWSIAELREAMAEAGFASSAVYKDINVAPGHEPEPVADPAELGEDWIVMIVART